MHFFMFSSTELKMGNRRPCQSRYREVTTQKEGNRDVTSNVRSKPYGKPWVLISTLGSGVRLLQQIPAAYHFFLGKITNFSASVTREK